MYKLFRSLLFKLDPETAHVLTLYALRSTQSSPPALWLLERAYAAPPKPVEAFGLTFKNPVGLAAGYDKDGIAVRGLSALGFGHIEVGTVTPRPQPGNPKPRVFRLVEDEAVINRMGFPGRGAEYVEMSLSRSAAGLRVSAGRVDQVGLETLSIPSERGNLSFNRTDQSNRRLLRGFAPRNDIVIGVNLGKNKDTPLEEAASDYVTLMHAFAPLADYLAINISSPNTVGLRRLQGREMLESLSSKISKEREQIKKTQKVHGKNQENNSVNSVISVVKTPILVKLAPDLNDDELEDALGAILACGMDGVIATNTTLARDGLRSKYQVESGGLSGSPLRFRSEAILEKIVRLVDGRIPIISVGGIMSPEDAKRRLDRGAALVQVYTGLVYRGPGLVRKIINAL